MPRKPRIALPGIPQHVVQRGNNKQNCFNGDVDYFRFLSILGDALRDTKCSLHAYALMSNHFHLLITPLVENGLSLLMMDVGRKYVRYFNDTYERTGTLWEGRFKSAIIESDLHCLACYRYIERNPVNAAIVSAPGDYRWSSYGFNALGETSKIVTPHGSWLALGDDDDDRRMAYRGLFNDLGGQVPRNLTP